MSKAQFERVLQAGFGVLDKANKSIFLSNVSKICRGHRSCTFTRVAIKQVIIEAPEMRKLVKTQLQVAPAWLVQVPSPHPSRRNGCQLFLF